MHRSCPCGFEGSEGLDPRSAEWHRGHREQHLAKYPNVDEVTRAALNQLVDFAERKQFAPPPPPAKQFAPMRPSRRRA